MEAEQLKMTEEREKQEANKRPTTKTASLRGKNERRRRAKRRWEGDEEEHPL